MGGDFETAMELMRKRNPQLREDGFHSLLPVAHLHLAALTEEFESEEDDLGLRRWLLELIASAGDPAAIPVLERSLRSADESLQAWGVRGLEAIGTRDARIALRRHRGEPL